MKNLVILATMLLTFGFAHAQGKIYSVDSWGDAKSVIGRSGDGKIYSVDSWGDAKSVIGRYGDGKIYSVDSWGDAKSVIGRFEHSAAAAAYILLF